MLIVVANLHGDAIGKIGFESCAICQRGLVCKVETYPPYDGYGIGGLLVDAALAAGGRPSDGFSWYTTGQYRRRTRILAHDGPPPPNALQVGLNGGLRAHAVHHNRYVGRKERAARWRIVTCAACGCP
ncbi:hypothetical protein [Fodinicola feengrottensis]|uniref:hypothetical protein n=1 Tax=Fodinicola feengrottensis TaxID=435914 RepID=UPI0013D10DCA|nr:hypothetical protein [Fodinicola feengrottensis]